MRSSWFGLEGFFAVNISAIIVIIRLLLRISIFMINVYRSTRQIYLQHLNRIDGSRKKIETGEIRYSELKFHQLLYE